MILNPAVGWGCPLCDGGDIDSLVIINATDLQDKSPQAALAHMENSLEGGGLADAMSVHHGRMAVTVEYRDGITIQLLPALKDADGRLHVPSSRRDGWSRINLAAFSEALTHHNQQCGNKLIPTIKLAKAINGTLPEAQKLSGYHMESLGIGAFRNFDGEKTTTVNAARVFRARSRAGTLAYSGYNRTVCPRRSRGVDRAVLSLKDAGALPF
jgi:hypothetical protein